MYHLNAVQDFNPDGLFDIPPLPIDSCKEVNYSGTYDRDKNYFVVQDSPLPFHITMIVPHIKQVSKT